MTALRQRMLEDLRIRNLRELNLFLMPLIGKFRQSIVPIT
jgi:hypothetical protein